MLLQLQNLVTAKADEGVIDEQREGMEAALQASTSSLGSLLDTKADNSQVCPATNPLLTALCKLHACAIFPGTVHNSDLVCSRIMPRFCRLARVTVGF